MTRVTCDRCGATFDPDLEPPIPGASTDRCPSCGKQHEPTEAVTDGGQSIPVNIGDGEEIHLHIHVHRPN